MGRCTLKREYSLNVIIDLIEPPIYYSKPLRRTQTFKHGKVGDDFQIKVFDDWVSIDEEYFDLEKE